MKTRSFALVGAFTLASSAQALALPSQGSSIYFEPNWGQAQSQVKFSSRGAEQRLLISEDTIGIRGQGQPMLRLQLVGASPLRPVGDERLPGVSHYRVGANRAQWAQNVPHYAKVRLPQVYAGVDFVAYGKGSDVEYDFVVAAGTDPKSIRLRFTGANSISVADNGDLLVQSDAGEVRHARPFAYQDLPSGRRQVAADYRVSADGEVTFQLGAYDTSRQLVIDPVLTSTWRRGASGTDVITDIVTDGSGNVYATGYTDGNGFPTSTGAAQTSHRGDVDSFVTKLSPSGTVLYSTFFGGNAQDNAHAIALDSGGRAYVVGETRSTDLQVTRGFQSTAQGKSRAFVMVLAADGRSIAYSSYLGGSSADAKLSAWDVATSPSGEMWLTGETTVPSFPFTINGFQRTLDPQNAEGLGDAFVMRINPALSGAASVTYFSYYGGAGRDVGRKLSRSPNGGVMVAGDTDSSNLPVTKDFHTGGNATQDAFLLKTTGATSFEGAIRLGGNGSDRAGGVAFDKGGNIYFAGETTSSDLAVSSDATQKTRADLDGDGGLIASRTDAFVVKLNANGTTQLYLTYLGGNGDDRVQDVAVTGSGVAYVAGTTFARNFPTTPGAIQTGSSTPRDGFLTKLSANGARAYSTYLGGTGIDDAMAVAIAGATTWVASSSESSSFPGAPAALGDFDGVLSKLTASALLVVGNTALNAADAAIQSRLQGLGFNVTVKAATASSGSDANGKDLIVVSSTVASGDVNTKFKNSAVGLLNLEEALQDDLGLTGSAASEFGRTTGQTQVSMLSNTDPISAGLSGNQTVTTAGRNFNWGRPNANAVKVASLLGDGTRFTAYRYEVGSTLVGSTKAAERRTGLFAGDDVASAFTASGWSLFDAAARWTAGQ